MHIWTRPDLLGALETERANLHKKHRFLAFDCADMHCIGQDYAYCKKGKLLTDTRLIPVVAILRGDTPLVCKICQEEKEINAKLETKL
jgi:hypothetical protein